MVPIGKYTKLQFSCVTCNSPESAVVHVKGVDNGTIALQILHDYSSEFKYDLKLG